MKPMLPLPFPPTTDYAAWRRRKLAEARSAPPVHELADPSNPTAIDLAAITAQVTRRGFALYRLPPGFRASRQWLIEFGRHFGLTRLDSNLCSDADGISTLRDTPEQPRRRSYVPYTNRPLNWHTDGYYNPADQQIGAFILHCVQDAAHGGENGLMDPALAWLRLYDEDPAFVEALSHPGAMSIPPNTEDGKEIHGWISGPVFSFRRDWGRLHMRYTARRRNIRWRDDPTTSKAVAFLQNLLESGENDVVWLRLAPGEGVISNNALHCRKGFTDAPGRKRLYYRARYFDSIGRP